MEREGGKFRQPAGWTLESPGAVETGERAQRGGGLISDAGTPYDTKIQDWIGCVSRGSLVAGAEDTHSPTQLTLRSTLVHVTQ